MFFNGFTFISDLYISSLSSYFIYSSILDGKYPQSITCLIQDFLGPKFLRLSLPYVDAIFDTDELWWFRDNRCAILSLICCSFKLSIL